MGSNISQEYIQTHLHTAERLVVLGGHRLFRLILDIFAKNDKNINSTVVYPVSGFLE